MASTLFEVPVSIDDWKFDRDHDGYVKLDRREILASFEAALDHWIAERRLELRYAD